MLAPHLPSGSSDLSSPPTTPAARRTRRRLWIATIAGLVLVVAVLAGVKVLQIRSMIGAGKAFAIPPESVSSAKVEATSWQPTHPAIGSLVAVHGVTLGAELAGTVREIAFDSGSSVRKGALLVRLDTSTEQAQLAAAEVEAALARIALERARSLRQSEANAQADLDTAEARAKQAEASVAGLRATIAKKTIRAPFDGRLAIRQVELGQVVLPGTPIASLQSVDPIHADFWLPQQALAALRPGQAARLRTDTFPGSTWDGTVTTINTEVDQATRNVRIRATFPNADGRLRPGMFVNVEVLSSGTRPVLLIPATAVLFAPFGDSVFVLEEGKDPSGKATTVAKQKFVRLGERRGDFVEVLSGLAAGETVVSGGAFKLRNGSAVVVKNDLAPSAEIHPKPSEQ
ncbi:MAG TPA: efflux RND transporter periplasmic adaptor subunit [Anaeromyxobacteraceae bacterium]|nr:efflux RND transporter periplasmic adaptor subunit [Anaeromyxobacteraceae bacterium]